MGDKLLKGLTDEDLNQLEAGGSNAPLKGLTDEDLDAMETAARGGTASGIMQMVNDRKPPPPEPLMDRILPAGLGRVAAKAPFIGAGAMSGAELGSLGGPIAAALGGILGGAGGAFTGENVTRAVDQFADPATAQKYSPSDAIVPSLVEGVTNYAIPFGVKKGGILLTGMSSSVRNAARTAAEGKLLLALKPTAVELAELSGEPTDNIVSKGIDLGLFDGATHPKIVLSRIAEKIGMDSEGRSIVGSQLDAAADVLDRSPGMSFSWADDIQPALDDARAKVMTRLVDPRTGLPQTKTGDLAVRAFSEKIAKLKGAITGDLEKRAAPLRAKLNDIQSELDGPDKLFPGSNKYKGLVARRDSILKELGPLQERIENPTVSFSQLYKAQKTFDIEAQGAYAAAESGGAVPELAKVDLGIAHAARDLVKQRAISSGTDTGAKFVDAKEEFETLINLKSMVERANKSALTDPARGLRTPRMNWAPAGADGWSGMPGIGPTIGFGRTRLGLTGKTARKLNTTELFEDAAGLLGAEGGIRAPGNPLSIGARMANYLTPKISTIASQVITNEIPLSVDGLDENLDGLKDSLVARMLSHGGIDIQNSSMADVPPEAVQQASEAVDQMIGPIQQALAVGDHAGTVVEYSKIVKQFPDMFESPQSGILGEVKIGKTRKLPDVADRERYLSLIRMEKEGDVYKRAKAANAMNIDGTVLPFK